MLDYACIYDDYMKNIMIDVLRIVAHGGDILRSVVILCFVGTNSI